MTVPGNALRNLFRGIQRLSKDARKPSPHVARIIPRAEHAISRKSISSAALRVLYRLHEAGFAAFLVGGAVRDLLLGGHPKDFDIATDATPEQVKHLFRNCRLIGRRFRLAHVVFGSEIIEVATFRGHGADGDREIVDGRITRDNIWGSLEEDALRRDFTVNALYYNIADFSVRDDVGGMQDLQDRVLRLIGDPEQRYREDPVRMLRAVRLAAKLDFDIDAAAVAPFATLGPLLGEAPSARLFDESLKLFLAGHGLQSFRLLDHYGLLAHLYPVTARALARDQDAGLRALIEQALVNTDARVAADKSVTPAFLFAVLLWGETRAQAEARIAAGDEPTLAWQHAAARVVAEQSDRVAIPRRFGTVMEEIWALQPRFAQRARKRVFRLMAHPRFRAAYDFLLLRASESPELAELGSWWTAAQTQPPEQLAAALDSGNLAVDAEATPARKRRRRSRRKKPASAAD
ncbi:MAG: polynucleotide adenylyltransferase PcnB [Xanthomonadaceae bacterium]|nr:polynucleotide adenylyltransferase PcnB [Xanthomonadaceae bacterium]MDE1958095.1 polynucleotide adenylyltransferase PcnB [Xanthomonadaceae bacterium]MDE2244670.1 polynucleotide adenylyltransferase PcnB [Xanthomonadaceae bacterium]